MADLNSKHNRAVWFDIPVEDLDRATAFYAAVLAIPVQKEVYDGFAFSTLDHREGNGGCLVPKPGEVAGTSGILLYLNAEGRIREAVRLAEAHGGSVIESVEPIGPHGFRAVIKDSEGNRVALHSTTDAEPDAAADGGDM